MYQTPLRQYSFHSTWPQVLHDRPPYDPSLHTHMRDALELFRLRVTQLGDVNTVTTQSDEDELRLMLNVLIAAKEALQEGKEY